MSSRILRIRQAHFSRRKKSYDPVHDPDLPSNYHQWSPATQETWCAIMTDLTRQDAAPHRSSPAEPTELSPTARKLYDQIIADLTAREKGDDAHDDR